MISNLPPRCDRCAKGDWPYAVDKDGVERCNCARGRALLERDNARPGEPRRNVLGITTEQATIAVRRFAARMRFFPLDEFSQSDIGDQLIELVCSPDELDWLVREASLIYRDWPGILALRALYCSVFFPRDGITVESPEGELPELPARRRVAGLLSGDADMQYLAEGTARQLAMPLKPPPTCPRCQDKGWVAAGSQFVACDCENGRALPPRLVALLNGAPPPAPPPPPMPSEPITQADIDALIEQKREGEP